MTTKTSRPTALALATAALITLTARSGFAQTNEPPPAPAAASQPATAPAPSWPRVGGHWGFALSLVSVTNTGTTVIGHDYVNFGISPGVTVKLDPHWAIDFEFVAYGNWTMAHGATPASSATSFALDPGVIWNPGPVALGLRGAIVVGEHIPFNIGIIPIIVKAFPVTSRVSFFIELDLPVFVQAEVQQAIVSFGPQFQSGVAF